MALELSDGFSTTSEAVPIAAWAEFVLLERPSRSLAWRNLKLVRDPREVAKQNTWSLGWNGERLADNTDAKRLHPVVRQWVICSVKGAER